MKYLITLLFVSFYTFAYFPIDYESSRKNFRKSFPQSQSYKIKSEIDNDLTIDYAYLENSKETQKLLVINTGIHGPEGYTGSAAIQILKEHYLKEIQSHQINILIIHALNPYGFKYHRRFTENNVDLNRNQSQSPELFKTQNKAYINLKPVLTPETKAKSIRWSYYKTLASIIKRIITGTKLKDIREATAKGQYQDKAGIFFGGNDFEPNTLFIQKTLKEKIINHHDIIFLDFHTGLGEKGKLHLISTKFKNDKSKKLTNLIFPNSKEYLLTTPETKGFYQASGDLLSYITNIAPKDAKVISLAAEFGTVGTGIFSQIDTINRIIIENQGHFYGFKNEKFRREVKQYFLELFHPKDVVWRQRVTRAIKELFNGPILNWAKNETSL